ncbi:unnamed protein product [Onchocerca flexuosa]|uniref:Uncharacterized protein n=1 Tax=Onchocerca flexuosa TaxID=387005 RepID=A0A183GYR8_9BILA|nr:unnamed protein product [Onchocerca flexuosa]
MEALQRMMTKRLDEHSYKRTAKRLVVNEYVNDVDFNDKTEISNMNPAYDILYGETIRARSNPNSSTIGASFSATTCSATTSPGSLYHIEPTHTVTTTTILNDDHSRTDKLLRKISLAVRRKLTMKPFVNEQRNPYIISNCGKDSYRDDSKSSQRTVQNDMEKQIRLKSARKVIDLVDMYAIGRKHRSEHRKLLNEEYGED